MSTTLRVSEGTRERIAAIAAATGHQMQSVVEEAVDVYEKQLFWDAFEEGYERLSLDEEAWREVRSERRGEEGALRDGLE